MFSEEKLQNLLKKCELQYRVDNDGYVPLEWLDPHCTDTKELARYLREIGFRIEYIEEMRGHYVETCTGVVVEVMEPGAEHAIYRKV